MITQPAKSYNILVVEDEGLIAHDIAERLRQLGHTVKGVCSTAAEAVEQAVGADLILMDIRLDGKADGVEAATQIRDLYHIPVVFLTAHTDRNTLERAKVAGAFGYMVKPLAHASLQTSVEMAIYRHRMERELEEREMWLKTIFGSVGDAVVVADPEGRVIVLNRAAEVLTGWTQAEAQGQPISKVVRLAEEDSESEASDPVALAILSDSPVPLGKSWKLTSRGGREMMMEGEAAPVKASGITLGTVLTLRDVSARRWEERQQRQSQKLEAMARLAAGVSNDYSNLHAIIRSQAEQILRHFGEYSGARRCAEEIRQAASAAEEMNRRLADLGTRQVSTQEVLSLNAMLRRLNKLLRSVIGEGIELSMRLNPATSRIRVDEAQIEQVIMRLVIHASASMPGGGRVLIETSNADLPMQGRTTSFAMLAVTYTGQDADPEKLFEPSSLAEDELALSMIHGIVTEHSGYISAHRTAAGACRFEMMLPAWIGQTQLPAAGIGTAPAVLLVENRDPMRVQMHNFFEANGYNLLEAADAGEALAIAHVHEGPLDLLIAEAAEVDAIQADLKALHPSLAVLRIVDGPQAAPNEICRPFKQQTLLAQAETVLGARAKASTSA